MSPATVEKRRAVLINVAYIALVLGAFYLFMKYAFWTVAPFLFAFLVAAALQRPTNFISKKTHIKKGIVSVIAVLLIIALLITIVALTGARGRVRGQGTRLDTHRVAQESARLCKKLGGFALSLHRASAGRTSKLSRGCDKIILGQAPAIIRRACGSARAGRRAELQYQSFVYPQDSAQRRLVNREADSEYFGRRAPVYYRRLLHDRRI